MSPHSGLQRKWETQMREYSVPNSQIQKQKKTATSNMHIKLTIICKTACIRLDTYVRMPGRPGPSLHFILWGYACCFCCMQLSLVCFHELFVVV